MYENWKVAKSVLNPTEYTEEAEKKAQEAQEEYTNVAKWCNEGQQYHIEDIGDYYATVKNPEPTHKELLEMELSQLKQYLSSTDYITAKMTEVADDPVKFAEMKEHYHDELESRESARVRIREIEKELAEESE